MGTVIRIIIEIILALLGPVAEVISAIIVAIIEWLTGGGDGGMSFF